MPTDNVGDNVGDIAGMGADLFGSFAESTCAALVVAAVSELGTSHNWTAMMFPLMVSAAGILVCVITTLIATDLKPARHISEIEHTLKMQLIISTLLMTPVREAFVPSHALLFVLFSHHSHITAQDGMGWDETMLASALFFY